MNRRPRPLLPAPVARVLGFAALAAAGAAQWHRYISSESVARPVLWVLTAVAAAVGVLASQRAPRRYRAVAAYGAAAAGLVVSVATSGLELRYLKPSHWSALVDGLGGGLQAWGSVRLPYIGRDPWVVDTIELSGALLCTAAAVLAVWPRGRGSHRTAALVLLLVLAASPIVSMGVPHPVALGLVLSALTACFLSLERVARRPGLGLAVLAVLALAAAVPLGAAANREEPWFDYKAFADDWGGGKAVSYSWNHRYGPINWPREGFELFRVRSPAPLYWTADLLDSFDGREWTDAPRADPGGDVPRDDLPANWRSRPTWTTRYQVSLKRLKTPEVVGAGTILGVTDATRPVEEGALPGRWVATSAGNLTKGDSYIARSYVPHPTPVQLAAATVGRDTRRHGLLQVHVDFRPDALPRTPSTPATAAQPARHLTGADIEFRPFETGQGPVAHYRQIGVDGSGTVALDRSVYRRTWALAQQLRRRATSPYDYVLEVNSYLRNQRFQYTEVPPDPGGTAPLEFFLFDSRLGYCQQFSGAMALLLRMGGIPARVATGFSPGGLRSDAGEWIVRDTDAHSWVEAWFDGIGWVTFDPTPPGTPARSQIAAIDPRKTSAPTPTPAAAKKTKLPPARRPQGLSRDPIVRNPAGGEHGSPAGTIALGVLAAVALVLAGLWIRVLRRRPRDPLDRALAELDTALRRSGRQAGAGITLAQLERRLGMSGEAAEYLRSLRALRYGARSAAPTGAQRAAFRRDLASGLGPLGLLRMYYALPPSLRSLRSRPGSSADRATAS